MKQLTNIKRKMIATLCVILAAVPAIARVRIDSSSVYEVKVARHPAGLYDGPLPYLVFGVIIAALGILGYFYWKNGMQND